MPPTKTVLCSRIEINHCICGCGFQSDGFGSDFFQFGKTIVPVDFVLVLFENAGHTDLFVVENDSGTSIGLKTLFAIFHNL